MLFAHGFGCDQTMWRYVWPAFEDEHQIVLFDHVGMGRSDASAYDPGRYATLDGYAQDVLDICARARSAQRGLRRPFGERHDRHARGRERARSLRAARPRRTLAALHRRRWLHRRLHARRHRRAAGLDGQQLSRLVQRDGACDHRQRGSPRDRRGARQQLLPRRSRDRPPLRAGDVPVRQPRRPRARPDAQPRAAVLAGRDRAGAGRPLRRTSTFRTAGSCCSRRRAIAPTSARPRRPSRRSRRSSRADGRRRGVRRLRRGPVRERAVRIPRRRSSTAPS